jgi:hypothetical protein
MKRNNYNFRHVYRKKSESACQNLPWGLLNEVNGHEILIKNVEEAETNDVRQCFLKQK